MAGIRFAGPENKVGDILGDKSLRTGLLVLLKDDVAAKKKKKRSN
jgi:hypothetical protein